MKGGPRILPEDLDGRFVALLTRVRDGLSLRDARHLDLLISRRYSPREHATVLDELVDLERRGLVARRSGREGGVGYRWQTTNAGLESLRGDRR